MLLLREGVEPGRFGCHRWSSGRGRHKIPEKNSLKIKSYFKTKSLPVSCRTEVEVAGQVGETGVQVARDELTVGGWAGLVKKLNVTPKEKSKKKQLMYN